VWPLSVVDQFAKIFVHCDDDTIFTGRDLQYSLIGQFGVYGAHGCHIISIGNEPRFNFFTNANIYQEFKRHDLDGNGVHAGFTDQISGKCQDSLEIFWF